jgi:hypothetical protein
VTVRSLALSERPAEPPGAADEQDLRHPLREWGAGAEQLGDPGSARAAFGSHHSFPLVVADYEGDRYVVAMLGQNANWVRNVRAAGGRAVLRHGRRERVRLEEVDPAVRAPILHRYLALRPRWPGTCAGEP